MAAGRPAYCSRECQRLAGQETRPCTVCGDPITRQAHRFRGDRAWCDKPSCKAVGVKPRTRLHFTCPECHQGFERTPSRADDGQVRYCSIACRAKRQGERQRIEREPRACPACGVDWTPTADQQANGQVACSRPCAGVLRRRPPGTRTVDRHGYAWITTEDGKSVLEHRHVMEQMIGRALVGAENVHHRNKVRDDNRPANLELWLTGQPTGGRVDDLTAAAVDMLRLYAPHLLADPDKREQDRDEFAEGIIPPDEYWRRVRADSVHNA